jgi:hypothetical protein
MRIGNTNEFLNKETIDVAFDPCRNESNDGIFSQEEKDRLCIFFVRQMSRVSYGEPMDSPDDSTFCRERFARLGANRVHR